MEGSQHQAAPRLQAEGHSSLSALLTGAARDVKSERRQEWSGMALRWVIPRGRQPHPMGGVGLDPSCGRAVEQEQPELPSDTPEVLHICLSVLFRKGSLPLR